MLFVVTTGCAFEQSKKKISNYTIIPKFLLEVTFTHDADIVKKILRESPSLARKTDENGKTPLHWAVMSGQLPVVQEFLLERDRPAYCVLSTDLINSADNNGDTVLHLAAKMESTEV